LVPHSPQVTGSFGRGFAVAALKRVPPHCGHLSVNLICVISVVVVSQVGSLTPHEEPRAARGEGPPQASGEERGEGPPRLNKGGRYGDERAGDVSECVGPRGGEYREAAAGAACDTVRLSPG